MVGDTSIFKTLNDFGFELKCINIIKRISDELILNPVGLPKLTSPKLKAVVFIMSEELLAVLVKRGYIAAIHEIHCIKINECAKLNVLPKQ